MSTKTETLKSRDISGFMTKYAIYIVLVVSSYRYRDL